MKTLEENVNDHHWDFDSSWGGYQWVCTKLHGNPFKSCIILLWYQPHVHASPESVGFILWTPWTSSKFCGNMPIVSITNKNVTQDHLPAFSGAFICMSQSSSARDRPWTETDVMTPLLYILCTTCCHVTNVSQIRKLHPLRSTRTSGWKLFKNY